MHSAPEIKRADTRIRFTKSFRAHGAGEIADLGYGRGDALVMRKVAEWVSDVAEHVPQRDIPIIKRGRGRPRKVAS